MVITRWNDHWNDLKVLLFQSYTSLLQRLRGAGRGGKTQLLKKKKKLKTKNSDPLQFKCQQVMEAIADMESFDRLDLSENRYLRISLW